MKVKVAKTAGFCMGVRRAMDIVLDAADDKEKNSQVYTDGPLIHNPQVLELLEAKGIGVLKDKHTLADNSTVVIRAHGITPQRRKEIEASGARLSDATCPHVMRVQSIIKKYTQQGFHTIIVGDNGHAEVVGLLGYTEGRGYVVERQEDIEKLPHNLEKVCVVAQTTQNQDMFAKIAETLKKRYKICEVFSTICSSTSRRQDEVIALAKSVDVMIVVGGKGSANTNRLVKICEEQGTATFHIETENEIDFKKLEKYDVVGVTAGASTPQWLIKRVVDRISSYEKQNTGHLRRLFRALSTTFIASCLYIGLGAVCLSYASALLLGVKPQIEYCAVAALFLFSMHVLNHAANRAADALNEPARATLYEKYRMLFLVLSIGGIIASYGVSFFLDFSIFLLVFFASVFFTLAFRLEIIPTKLSNTLRYHSVEKIAGSKEVFFSIAWMLTTALIPFLLNDESISPATLAVALSFAFTIAFIRAVLLAIRDIQGDRIVGKETLPIAMGKDKTKIMLITMAGIMAGLLLASPWLGWTSFFSYYLLACVTYACLYLYLYHRRIIGEGMVCETVVDFNFILAGIMAFLYEKIPVTKLMEPFHW